MNYYQARELADHSGWRFTRQNDGDVWAVGACRGHGPHATAEDADRCFYEYEMAVPLEVGEVLAAWSTCEKCAGPTKHGIRPNGYSIMLDIVVVCDSCVPDEAAARTFLREWRPFQPGIAIVSSY